MWKFGRWAWNVASIPWRAIGTGWLLVSDSIKTTVWSLQNAWSVVLNTTNKIVHLFSDEQKRYQKILNIPVAAWVWLAWAIELAVKPVVNGAYNVWKTGLNLVTNARKSTFGSLFSTKPISDTSFNTIKFKDKTYKIDTEEPLLNPHKLRTRNRWYLSKDEKVRLLEAKKAKIAEKIEKLNAAS